MLIRKAVEGDIHKVSHLWREMVSELNPEYTPMSEWWRSITLNMMRNHKEYCVFVAEDNGKLIGFIDFLLVSEPSIGGIQALGRHFYVKPEYRKPGVAFDLYCKSIEEIRKRGGKTVSLPCKPDSVHFWGKRGFKVSEILLRKEIEA